MTSFVSFAVELGNTFGWGFVSIILFGWELFCPSWLHPAGGTKLQKLLMKPSPVVVVTLEAIAEEMEDIDDDKIRDLFNGGGPYPSDLKTDKHVVKDD